MPSYYFQIIFMFRILFFIQHNIFQTVIAHSRLLQRPLTKLVTWNEFSVFYRWKKIKQHVNGVLMSSMSEVVIFKETCLQIIGFSALYSQGDYIDKLETHQVCNMLRAVKACFLYWVGTLKIVSFGTKIGWQFLLSWLYRGVRCR